MEFVTPNFLRTSSKVVSRCKLSSTTFSLNSGVCCFRCFSICSNTFLVPFFPSSPVYYTRYRTLKTWRANYYSTRNTLPAVTLPFALGDRAEETICLIVDARCEEERVSRTRQGTIAKAQCPQAVDSNWIAFLVFELAAEATSVKFVGIDAAVTEIANQQVLAEATETLGGKGQAPGRVECTMRNETLEQVPTGVEDIDKAITWPCLVIMLARFLEGIGDIEIAVNVLDAERSETLACEGTIVR